jgi:hypothetical protein
MQILAVDGISSAQLESAIKAARLVKVATRSERDKAIVQAIRRSQRALSRELTESFKPSVTSYSLEYLNTAGRFSPEQIVKSFRHRPKGTVLLYGPPGTGKTQFTEHLANELGLPLVSKSASALLSKWLGDSEKNIASAFEEAAAEDAILFFDEGDSFLRSRERAHHAWEVTQTNELLQKMERFDGIVIVATNLFRDLDAAALRRFTFKIEFRELDLTQRWKMFVTEAGLTDRVASMMLEAGKRGKSDCYSCGTSLQAILLPSSGNAWCWIRLLRPKSGWSSWKSSVRPKVPYHGSNPWVSELPRSKPLISVAKKARNDCRPRRVGSLFVAFRIYR